MTPEASEFPPRRILCAGAVVLHEQRVLLVRQTYGDLRGTWSIPWGYIDAGDGTLRLYLLFLSRHVGGQPTPDGAETDRAAYFSLAEVEQRAESIDPFCCWIARRALLGDYRVIPANPDTPYAPHAAYL